MRTVISASRRTDLPAFHTPWLLERLGEGRAAVANPYRRTQVREVSLRPEDVAWFVFWSRDYSRWLPHAAAFSDYRTAFHFTITSGHPRLEPRAPEVSEALRQAGLLAAMYGGERIFWRYDPIVSWRERDGSVRTSHRPEVFAQLSRELGGLGVRRCIVSFAQLYAKVRTRMKRLAPELELLDLPRAARHRIAAELRDVAAASGIGVEACCTSDLLEVPGIGRSRCIDGGLLREMGGEKVSVAKAATRDGCGCTASVDIGDYLKQPCRHGCLYCYANADSPSADVGNDANETLTLIGGET